MMVSIGMQHVIVGTDLSLDGDRAVRRAALLPLKPRAAVTVTHVLPARIDRAAASVIRGAADIALENAARKLARWLAERRREDVTVAHRIVRGSPADELARVAATDEADLLVVGRRGQSRLRRALLGSAARRLVEIAPCPVLVVSRSPRGPYREVVVGHDLSPSAARAARVARMIAPHGASLTAVHGYEDPLRSLPPEFVPPNRAERRAAAARMVAERDRQLGLALRPLTAGRRPWRRVVRAADPRELLLDVARDRKADLVAVGTEGRPAIDRVFVGSVARWVLDHATGDVLVARAGSR